MIYLDNAGTTKPSKEVLELVNDIEQNFYFKFTLTFCSFF